MKLKMEIKMKNKLGSEMYDIAVIGAGVTGSAIAWALSRYDWKTVVLEKNLEVGEGTTKANSAVVHGGYDALPGSLKAKLNVAGARLIRTLAQELDFPYRNIGSLVLAFDEADEAILRDLLARGIQNGVQGLSILSREEVLALEPNVSPEVKGALLCTDAGIVCPFNLTFAFIENALANGVALKRDFNVRSIAKDEGGYRIETGRESVRAKVIINASGIHADAIAKLLGETDYVIRPRKGEYRVLEKSEGNIVDHVIFQTPSPLGKGIIVTPTVFGNLLIGPNSLETTAEDLLEATKEGLAFIDGQAKKAVPGLNLQKTIRTFSGLRATPDGGDFLIYHSRQNPGFFHAAGIESPGLSSSPAIAGYLLQLVLDSGLLPPVLKADVIRRRTGIKALAGMTAQDKAAAVRLDPAYGNIICRCEGVSEAEVRDAIHRPAGAVTIDGVKRRVRAGMGPCQGTYCRPRVTKILAEELGIPEDQVLKDSKGRGEDPAG